MIQQPDSSNGKPISHKDVQSSPQTKSEAAPTGWLEQTRVRLQDLLIAFRIPILIVVHAVIFSVGYFLAYAIRLDFDISLEMQERFWKSLPFVVGIEIGCFLFFRTFNGWWRYVTFRDLVSFVKPLVVSFVLILIVDRFLFNAMIPRSVYVINLMVCGLLMAVLRSSWRLAKEGIWPGVWVPKGHRRAFLFSNNFETLVLANQINAQQSSTTRIIGILSDEQRAVGLRRAGIPILGTMHDAPELAAKHDVDQVWLIAGSLPGAELAELKSLYAQHDIKINVIPSATDRSPGSSFIPVREIEIEDLLPRAPVDLNAQQIGHEIKGKRILVTGAGGSIGSEICRQLLKFEPSDLILVDHRENSVFMIDNELERLTAGLVQIHPEVADILNYDRMAELFRKHRPECMYHAAAHKHVGLMERQPGVAVHNNVTGTKIVADLANEFGVAKFVMISTDKAVNPTSVMGCTKQIAERYCLSLGNHSDTKFVVVRFGNVLGSNGSVVPIFKEQIERGGPITITDERMTRFFMTIPEASQLVLQAGAMGNGGEIFVLDMGKQVKIVDLARKMIKLAGLPENAIEIQVVGARVGEKLFEELYFEEEEMIATDHVKIFAAKHRVLEYNDVLECTSALEDACEGTPDGIRELFKTYISEYASPALNGQDMAKQDTAGQSQVKTHTYN